MGQFIQGTNAGKLSDLIVIVRKLRMQDAYGQEVTIPDSSGNKEVWASVQPLTGSEATEGLQIVQRTVYQVTVRHEPNLIVATDQVLWNNGTYDVETIHVLGRNQFYRFNIVHKDNGVVN